MAIIFDGTLGITSPGGDTSNTSHTTPIVRSPSALTLQTNGSTTAVTIDTSQNVGIGTSSPQMRVDVSGGVRVQSITNPSSGSGMELAYDGTQGIIQAYSNRATLASVPVYLVTGQLRFPPTQNPSSDANTLDDYEEGSWTPVFNGSSGSGTIINNASAGRYIKIGGMVWLHCQLHFNCSSAGSGSFSISGLPFTASNINGHGQALALGPLYNWNVDNSAYQIGARVNDASTSIFFWNNFDNAGDSQLSWPFAGGGTTVFGSITGCYRTD